MYVDSVDIFDVELFDVDLFDVELFDVFDDEFGRRSELLLLHGAGVEEAQNGLIFVLQNIEVIREVRTVT